MALGRNYPVAKIYLGRVSKDLFGDYRRLIRAEKSLLQNLDSVQDIFDAAQIFSETPLGNVREVVFRGVYEENILISSLSFKVSGETSGLELLCKDSCSQSYLVEKFDKFSREISKKMEVPFEKLYLRKLFNFKKS